MMAGLWRRRCSSPSTRVALSLLQLGMVERAQAGLGELNSQVAAGQIVVSFWLVPLLLMQEKCAGQECRCLRLTCSQQLDTVEIRPACWTADTNTVCAWRPC